MNKLLKQVAAVAVCASMLALSACGGSSASSSQPAGDAGTASSAGSASTPGTAGEGKTYVIRVACNDEAPRYENLEKAAARLTEQLAAEGSTDVVKTEYVLVNNDDKSSSFAMWNQTGDLPELAVLSTDEMVRFVDAGFLVEVGDVVKSEAYGKVYPGLVDTGIYNGQYYGVIQDMESRPVWFFKNHLTALGWSDADIAAFPGKVSSGEFTQKDLQNLAKEAVDKNISEWGITHRPTRGAEFWMMYMINGGMDPVQDGKVVIDSVAMTNFLTFLRENVEMGLCPGDITTFGWDPIEADIQPNGKTLCWYGGVWNMPG